MNKIAGFLRLIGTQSNLRLMLDPEALASVSSCEVLSRPAPTLPRRVRRYMEARSSVEPIDIR